MKNINVAIFTGNYNHIRDGVSLTLNRLVSFLMEKNANVLVFGPTINQPDLDHAGRLIAIPSIAMPGRPEYRLTTSFPRSAKKELEAFNPDLVHIATPDVLGLMALRWAKKNNKPVVASYHTHFSSYLKYYKLSLFESLMWKYLAWFYSRCLHVYVPSPSMGELLTQKNIKSDLRIWARGIDSNLFNPSKRSSKWRRERGFSDEDVIVTFVSRLVWEKNLDLFSVVMKELINEFKHVKAMVVGDGPAAKEMKKKFPNVLYTGFLGGEELAESYANSDIFFFPSDTETFGNVTLEAMASGLPCVVAKATGSSSLVDHNKNGFLVSVKHPKRFKTALKQLIEDPELRKKMAQISLEKSKEFNWSSINERLLESYKEVLVGGEKTIE